MRRIGLLGGTSWESSAEYYRRLNQGAQARLGGKSSADLVLRSLQFADVCALQEAEDWAALGAMYHREAAALAAAGAEVIGICANTMHLVHADVVAGSGVEVVHVVDAVADAAVAAQADRVLLLGTRYTMRSPDLYPARMAARGIDVIVPDDADAAEVHRIIYDELVLGQVLDGSRDRLRAIVGTAAARGARAVVLGCTELGMLLDPADSTLPVPALDSTSLHVDALLEAALAPHAARHHAPPLAEASLEEGAA